MDEARGEEETEGKGELGGGLGCGEEARGRRRAVLLLPHPQRLPHPPSPPSSPKASPPATNPSPSVAAASPSLPRRPRHRQQVTARIKTSASCCPKVVVVAYARFPSPLLHEDDSSPPDQGK
ncbi:hypothetical protein Droror1_Dr00000917 [Drosera rotundifolia]